MIVAQPAPVNNSSLRASPIQDMPVERAPGMQAPLKPSFVSPMMPPPPQTPEPAYQDLPQRSPKTYDTGTGEEDHDDSDQHGLVQTAIHRALRRRGSAADITSDNPPLDLLHTLPPTSA